VKKNLGLFRRKQEDRAAPYTIKLRRATYAKLGLIAERLGENEQNTLDGIIDFALASYTSEPKSGAGGLNLAGIISGEPGEDSDILSELAKNILPQLLSGGIQRPGAGNQSGPAPPNSSSPDPDISKTLKDMGL
jgi:hypothetical protein